MPNFADTNRVQTRLATENVWGETPVIRTTTATLSIDGTTKVVTRAAGSFITDGYATGDWVLLGGFVNAGNNGIFKITSAVGATTFTVADPFSKLVTEATVASATVKYPAFQDLRITGESMGYDKQTVISNEIRADRNVPDIVEVGVNAEGALNIELSASSFETLLEATLGGTWTYIALSALTLTVVSGAKTVTRSAGSWITDGVLVGTWIKFAGFTAPGDNKAYRVAQVTSATVLTLEDPNLTLVSEGPTAACTAKQKWVRNGVVKRSFLIEKEMQDIVQFIYFTGNRVNQLQLSLQAQQIVTGSFSFMSKTGVGSGATIAGGKVAASTTDVLSASANVSTLQKDGLLFASSVLAVQLTAQNNARHQPIVGSKFDAGIGLGRFDVEGSLEIYVEDLVAYNLMVNHTTIELAIPLVDAAGNQIIMTFPAIKLTKGNPQAGSGNADLRETMTFNTKLDSVTGCQMQIDVLQ